MRPKPPAVEKPIFLLRFDEAANIYDNIDPDDCQRREYRRAALCHVFRGARDHPVWAVFLSRNSKIEAFASSLDGDPSARVVSRKLRREYPFMALEVDLEYEHRLRASLDIMDVSIADFVSVDNMTSFGRPLWRLCADMSFPEMRSFIQKYMLSGAAARLDQNDIKQVFAILASRVCLDPCLNNAGGIQLFRDVVDSHLRLLIALKPPSALRTATPSEPVVAEAAAAILAQGATGGSPMDTWSNCIQVLTDRLLRCGLVDKGTKGELVARLLFVLARDSLSLQMVAPNTDFPFSRPFKVADFLDHMFGHGVVDQLVEQSLPPSRRSVSNWDPVHDFRAGVCNFSHFARTLNPLPSNRAKFENLLMILLRRNAALQLAPLQENWDIHLPFYTSNINLPIDHSHLSAIFVRVKNRQMGPNLVLGPGYNAYHHGKQLGICVQMELSMEPGPSQAIIRLGTPSEPVIFGMTAKGCSLDKYPFLGCHPGLISGCDTLLRTVLLEEPSAVEAGAVEKLECPQANSLPMSRYDGYTRGRQPPVVGGASG